MTTVRRFQVTCPRPKADGNGVWWHRIGSAFENDKGQISIFLDSLPLPDIENGTVKMMLFEPREEDAKSTPAPATTRRGAKAKAKPVDGEDDEIPF